MALLLVGPTMVCAGEALAFTGSDLVPPSLQITSPARGEYLSSPQLVVQGTATADGSGVASVEVNGAPVQADPTTGAFSVPV